MGEFMDAVKSGDLVAAKSAFDAEMRSRISQRIETVRTEVGASVGAMIDVNDDDENEGE